MFCPNCGAKTSTEQKFCRACGLGLEKIALSLTEQLPSGPDENMLSQKERLERWGVAALSVFGVGILGLILWGIVYKIMIAGKVSWRTRVNRTDDPAWFRLARCHPVCQSERG